MSAHPLDRRLSVAPMLDCTDRHERYLLRLISPQVLLYTEMVTSGALLHGDRERFLAFDPIEHPLALQLGGSEPDAMADCARIGQEWGYDEININVGCPSERVRAGTFGACLMAEPGTVAECVSAMRDAADLPVTVKTRIGIDHQDSYEALVEFVGQVARAGCRTFIIHARKAWLNGLSPRDNRTIPPLQYDRVYRLKKDFPNLEIIINGGIRTLGEVRKHLAHVDGAMIGREAYSNPYVLADAGRLVYGDRSPVAERRQILERYLPYVEVQLTKGVRLHYIARHLMGLFQGLPGAKAWRRHLGEHGNRKGAGIQVILDAAKLVEPLNSKT